MIRTLALLCLVAASAFGYDGGLRVRFDLTLFGIGTTAFIELPQSESKAKDDGWVIKTRPEGPTGLESLVLWCPSADNTVCVLIDDTGYIAGLQIALDVERFSDAIYDWPTQGFTYWTSDENGQTKNYWTTQQYYISAETLATDQAERIAARNSKVTLQDHSIWVPGINRELFAISTNVTEIASESSGFTKQACIPWMGDHYYYKMTPELECKADTMLPWFPLTYKKQLIGVGMVAYGKYTVPQGKRLFFEKPSRSAVKAIVPRGPECLYDLADNPGLVTIHTYFIQHPYAVTCVF